MATTSSIMLHAFIFTEPPTRATEPFMRSAYAAILVNSSNMWTDSVVLLAAGRCAACALPGYRDNLCLAAISQ